MEDEFSGIERLLGIPQGSTKKIDPNNAGKVLTKAVKNKADQLEKDLKKVDALTETMTNVDLVKCGMSLEMLEHDKEVIRNETFEVYRLGKTLLNKYMSDVKDQIDVNDRMYTAGGKLLDSVTGALDKLTNMILRFKQEEEIKGINLSNNNETIKQKEITTEQWWDWVENSKNESKFPTETINAEIVETEPLKSSEE